MSSSKKGLKQAAPAQIAEAPKPRFKGPRTTILVSQIRKDGDDRFTLPSKAYPGDAGFDLTAARSVTIMGGAKILVPFNMRVAIPPGYFGLVVGRSSIFFQTGLLVNLGVVDSGYRGELMSMVYNPQQRGVVIEAGQRISQLLILPLVSEGLSIEEVRPEDLPEGERGDKGFGSSGR